MPNSAGVTLAFTLERHQGLVDAINRHRRKLPAAAAAQPMVFGVDLSHWQGAIDFVKVKAAGFTFVVIKATEGNGYVDPRFAEYRAQAHAAGLIVRMYHYVGSSTGRRVFAVADELAWFQRTVGPLAVGEGVDLDWEPAVPPAGPTSWARSWLDGASTLGASPWIYMNSSTEAGYDWTGAGIPARYGLWLAKYDNNPDMDPVVHWPALAAEQYWDRATVPGIAGPVDVDVFYGTRDQLLAYCKGGSPTPSPATEDFPVYSQWSEAEKAAFKADLADEIWSHPAQPPAPAPQDGVWPGDRLRGVDDKTGGIYSMLKGGNTGGENNFHWTVKVLGAQIAGLQSALAAIAATPGGLTADQIVAAAKSGADQALQALADRIKADAGTKS